MSNARWVKIFEGKDGQWYFTPLAGNHEVLSTSEGYTRRGDAKRAALRLHPAAEIVYEKGGDE